MNKEVILKETNSEITSNNTSLKITFLLNDYYG
jgi:hypothetical protein